MKVWVCWKYFCPPDWDGSSEETIEHIYFEEIKAQNWLNQHPKTKDERFYIFEYEVE